MYCPSAVRCTLLLGTADGDAVLGFLELGAVVDRFRYGVFGPFFALDVFGRAVRPAGLGSVDKLIGRFNLGDESSVSSATRASVSRNADGLGAGASPASSGGRA